MNSITQQTKRDALGQIAYNAWKHTMEVCWEWEKLDIVTQEAWKDVGEAVRDAMISTPIRPQSIPRMHMQ